MAKICLEVAGPVTVVLVQRFVVTVIIDVANGCDFCECQVIQERSTTSSRWYFNFFDQLGNGETYLTDLNNI